MTDELAVIEPSPQPLALFGTTDPGLVIERASQVATVLAKIVNERKLYAIVDGKKFPTVEGWTMLGGMLGVFAHTEWTQPILDEGGKVRGYKARVVARTLSGIEVGAAEAMCMRGESRQWNDSAKDYALLSMAQTRATSKAMGNPLRWVFKLAGYEGASSEEMDGQRSTTGEIPVGQASPETATAYVEAQGSDQRQAISVDSPPTVVDAIRGSAAAVTPAPPHTPVARSTGPKAKRQNVVTAPQASTVPVAVAQEAPTSSAPPDLLDAAPAPSTPVDDGLGPQRQLVRQSAAEVVHVRAVIENVKRALEGQEAIPVPPKTPGSESDAALVRRIETDWPGRTLATLGATELQGLLERLEGTLAKHQAVMAERGIKDA